MLFFFDIQINSWPQRTIRIVFFLARINGETSPKHAREDVVPPLLFQVKPELYIVIIPLVSVLET